MLSSAQKTIDMAVFSYRNDKAGRSFTSVLFNAANNGVKVRLLIDGANVKIVKEELFVLIDHHPNIEVKIYNPVHLLKPWNFNYRLHDKFIVVDDELYILGGRNQNSLFIGDYDDEDRKNQDRDLLVHQEGKRSYNSLNQLQDYFEELWQLDEVKNIKSVAKEYKDFKMKYIEFERDLSHIYQQLKKPHTHCF